jgi:predicted DNA-binding ribbon-helix-helix protein
MQSTIVKHSIVIKGRKTSISLEDAFWAAFKRIAAEQKLTPSELAADVSAKQKKGNLSSAIRVYVLHYYYNQVTTP